jgi:hypothetical protein
MKNKTFFLSKITMALIAIVSFTIISTASRSQMFGSLSSDDENAYQLINSGSITNTIHRDGLITLSKDLKAYGLWQRCMAIYPVAGGTSSSHKFNLKDVRDLDAAYRLSYLGAGTIAHALTGMASDGNSYCNTHFNVTSTSLDDVHLSFYSRSSPGGAQVDFGAEESSPTTVGLRIVMSYLGSNYDYTHNDYPGSPNFNPANTIAYEIVSRTNSADYQVYKNGIQIVSVTKTSQQKVNFELYLLADNLGGSPFAVSTKECAFATVGLGFNSTQASNLNTIVEKYQDKLSRGVQ